MRICELASSGSYAAKSLARIYATGVSSPDDAFRRECVIELAKLYAREGSLPALASSLDVTERTVSRWIEGCEELKEAFAEVRAKRG